jgi:uncharacterized membrane protein YvbJ
MLDYRCPDRQARGKAMKNCPRCGGTVKTREAKICRSCAAEINGKKSINFMERNRKPLSIFEQNGFERPQPSLQRVLWLERAMP